MNMIQVIRKGADSTFKAGQTSLGAAREEERARMKAFFVQVEAIRATAREIQKTTELTPVDERLGEFLIGFDDLLHDNSVSEAAWGELIEEMR